MTLPANTGSIDYDFSDISSVRDLGAGIVLLSEVREKRLMAVSFKTRNAWPVGRSGMGPGEYSFPLPLKALRGDTTVMPDALSRRWILLAGTQPVATLPPDDPRVAAGLGWITGLDTAGNAWGTRVEPPPRSVGNRVIDSTHLVRVSARSGRIETVTWLRDEPRVRGHPSGFRPVGDAAAVFADGWVAIARHDPYRVDWVRPDGSIVHGRPLPVRRVAADERQRRFHVALRPGSHQPNEIWPDSVPVFRRNWPLLTSSSGQVVIRRTRDADHPNLRYDVVSRTGTLVATLQMPPGAAVIGFGPSVVYVVTTDDTTGLQRLTRHPWPLR